MNDTKPTEDVRLDSEREPEPWSQRPLTLQEIEDAIRKLQARMEDLRQLAAESTPDAVVQIEAVEQAILHNILEIFGKNSRQYAYLSSTSLIDRHRWQLSAFDALTDDPVERERRRSERYQGALCSAVSTVSAIMRSLEEWRQELLDAPVGSTVATRLARIFDRFHAVAQSLRTRYADRVAVMIEDEHDVHYVLRALLAVDFWDVRPEEPAPSHAGAAARVDFLLKDECVIVEVKKTRAGLTDRKLGEELTVDIARYKAHPDCRALYCFVYDPEHLLRNPAGLVKDLENGAEGFVRVFVRPNR